MIGSKTLNSKLSDFKRRRNKISLEKIAKRANRAFVTYFVLLAGLTYFSYTSINKFKEETLEEIKQETISKKPTIQYETIDTITKYIKNDRSLEITNQYGLGNDYLLYVNKNNNYADLINVKTDELIYRFKTSDGRNHGDKEKKADGKTPEGIYRILNASVSNNPFFGDYKIVIDYPNEEDKKIGKEGEGILICGPGNDYRKNAINNGTDSSNGGILLQNQDLKKLYDKIKEGRTLIVIEDENRPIGGV